MDRSENIENGLSLTASNNYFCRFNHQKCLETSAWIEANKKEITLEIRAALFPLKLMEFSK